MSGGHYDHKQYDLENLAGRVEEDMRRYDAGDLALARMQEIAEDLRRLSENVHHLDWWLSDDTGEDDFVDRYIPRSGRGPLMTDEQMSSDALLVGSLKMERQYAATPETVDLLERMQEAGDPITIPGDLHNAKVLAGVLRDLGFEPREEAS